MPDTGLTPIRIRGKKARVASIADGRALANASGSTSATSATAQTTSKRRRVGSSAAKSKANYVSFEKRLPLEVVEAIYLLSENINLSLCNKKLYWMLSRRQTRVEMALRAFAPSWELHWTLPLPKRLGVVRRNEIMWNPCDHQFQTALLSCPWVDAPLLLDAEAIWMRRTFLKRGRGRNEGKEWVRAVPWKEHVAFRRTTAPTDAWAEELQLDAAQALAIERAHDAFGCIDNRAHCWQTSHPNDDECEPHTNSWFSESPPRAPWWREIKKEAVPRRLPSTHVCFAYETLNATINLTYWMKITDVCGTEDDSHEQESITQPFEPCNNKHAYVHPKTRIPERLLLAEGAPADLADDAVLDEASLEKCRAQLQRTYQLLLWLVLGGAQLQPADSWEVTLAGHRRLLALATADERARRAKRKKEKEAAKAAKTEAEGAEDTSASKVDATPAPLPTDFTTTDATTPLKFSIKTLTVGMMALFTSLVVYEEQWPLKVLERQLKAEARKKQALGKAYVHTFASHYYMVIGRKALYESGKWEPEKHEYLFGSFLAAMDARDAQDDDSEDDYMPAGAVDQAYADDMSDDD